MTRQEALIKLLAMPDPPELIGRGRRFVYARDSKRDPDVIKRDLGTAYVSWRRQEWTNGDISCVVSVRRKTRLKIVRQA